MTKDELIDKLDALRESYVARLVALSPADTHGANYVMGMRQGLADAIDLIDREYPQQAEAL
jgi:hypothetical protein